MGSLLLKSKSEDKNTANDTMNLRSAKDKPMRHLSSGVGNQTSSRKKVDNNASVILEDMKQCCSNLSSLEVVLKFTPFSATQRNELNKILKDAQSAIERMMQTNHNAPITNYVAPVCHPDTDHSETLTKVAIAGTSNDTYAFHQENECSLEAERNTATRNVAKGKVGDSVPENTKDHTNPSAIGNSSGSDQYGPYLEIFKIKSFMNKLKKGEVKKECHVETLKNFEKFLTKYVNNSDKKNADHANSLLLNVKEALTNMQLKRTKHESIHSNEDVFIDGNAGRNKKKQINTDNSRSTNEKKEIENNIETGHVAQKRLDESKNGGTDNNCICTKEQCECSRNENSQKSESISFEEEKQSDDKRSRDEKKLKQIENRRNEIKSEIDCFVGPNSDPKFQELNEYSVRLLLEMDDLILPKGSDQHKRKRELLKEVYQYSDILEKKAKDFTFLAKVEKDINYIKNHFIDYKKSINDLIKVVKYIKEAKSKLYREDYENLLDERKHRCIDEMNSLEGAVEYIIHQESTNLSLANKSEEIVEDSTHSGRDSRASGDTSTKANSSTSNNGLNKNGHVIIDQEKCNEQSHRTKNEPNETRDIIENNEAVSKVKKILNRQEKGEGRITEDENVVAKIEKNINYIKNNFNDFKKSLNDLIKVAKYIKEAKSELYREDYENLLDERKQRCIDEIDGLEGAVEYIIHQKRTNLSLANKSEEIVEDATHSDRDSRASGDTSTKANSSTSNNGLNKNEHVIIEQEKCNEQSHRTENEPNETRDIIKNNEAVSKVKKILNRQEKGEGRITEDENVVIPPNQLQSIEGQSDDSHSGINAISYGPTETELDDIIRNVIGVREKIYSFIDFAALEDYQSLKDVLLREHGRLNAFNVESEVCEEIWKRICLVKKEILNWLDNLKQQIEALRRISHVEVELQRLDEIIKARKEKDIQKLRDFMLHLWNILQTIPSNNSQRLNKCFERIKLYSDMIEGETKTRNFDTMV